MLHTNSCPRDPEPPQCAMPCIVVATLRQHRRQRDNGRRSIRRRRCARAAAALGRGGREVCVVGERLPRGESAIEVEIGKKWETGGELAWRAPANPGAAGCTTGAEPRPFIP